MGYAIITGGTWILSVGLYLHLLFTLLTGWTPLRAENIPGAMVYAAITEGTLSLIAFMLFMVIAYRLRPRSSFIQRRIPAFDALLTTLWILRRYLPVVFIVLWHITPALLPATFSEDYEPNCNLPVFLVCMNVTSVLWHLFLLMCILASSIGLHIACVDRRARLKRISKT